MFDSVCFLTVTVALHGAFLRTAEAQRQRAWWKQHQALSMEISSSPDRLPLPR